MWLGKSPGRGEENMPPVDQGLGFGIRVNQPKTTFWFQIAENATQTEFRNRVHLFSDVTESPKERCLIERFTMSSGLGFHFSAFPSTLLSSMGQLLS